MMGQVAGKQGSNWQAAVERTVTALGYAHVDTERVGSSLLRVTIDRPQHDPRGEFVTVEDCELVTRQLLHVLEVEGCAYGRLEVSSPGLDRPLKTPADFARFAGLAVDLTLKLPFQGRKKFRGELQALGEHWRLVLSDDAGRPSPRKPAAKAKPAKSATSRTPAKTANAPELALDFSFQEVREARLVPVLDFKGRRFAEPAADATTSIGGIDGGIER